MIGDAPGDEHATGITFVSFDDQLVTAKIGTATPGDVVWPAHVDLLKSAGRNALAIVNNQSHQAHWVRYLED